MKVLLINTSERIGGAAIAANRLMEALKRNGIRVQMMVRDRQTQQLTVKAIKQSWLLPLKFLWERLVIFLCNGLNKHTLWAVDIANTGTDITQMPEFVHADVIHLHWVNQAFLSMENLRQIIESGKRIVVTMHDQWYFTGVCHYSADCTGYQRQCLQCPLMGHYWPGNTLAHKVFAKKQAMYAGRNITFVGCSRWMADMARKSTLLSGLSVVDIPNAINTDVFCPTDSEEARKALELPLDRQLLLFGSQRITDERKGFRFLAEACKLMLKNDPSLIHKLAIVVVGGDSDKVQSEVPFDVYPISYVSRESEMVKLYNAVDAFVTPSLQDNLPNTLVEALACGTPCVGFQVGGIPEMIDHKKNGYVARYCDAEDFATGIRWTLDAERHEALSMAARAKALATYSEGSVANRYAEVYAGIL